MVLQDSVQRSLHNTAEKNPADLRRFAKDENLGPLISRIDIFLGKWLGRCWFVSSPLLLQNIEQKFVQ